MNTEKSPVHSRPKENAAFTPLTIPILLILVVAGLIWHSQRSFQDGDLTYVGAFMLQNDPSLVLDEGTPVRLGKDLFLNNKDLTLTPSAAKYMADNFGPTLTIGASDLPPEVAEELAQSSSEIFLPNLESPSHETLSKLANGSFPSMTLPLTNPTIDKAEILGQFKGEFLTILNIGQLSADCAEAFAQCESGLLTLHGLEDLSEKAAIELSRSNAGSLHLISLKTLSGEAAAALSRFNGLSLYLGLNEVTDEAALALRQFPGSLTLTHVKSISESAAKVLSERKRFKCYSGRIRDQAFETLPAATADLLRKP